MARRVRRRVGHPIRLFAVAEVAGLLTISRVVGDLVILRSSAHQGGDFVR